MQMTYNFHLARQTHTYVTIVIHFRAFISFVTCHFLLAWRMATLNDIINHQETPLVRLNAWDKEDEENILWMIISNKLCKCRRSFIVECRWGKYLLKENFPILRSFACNTSILFLVARSQFSNGEATNWFLIKFHFAQHKFFQFRLIHDLGQGRGKDT